MRNQSITQQDPSRKEWKRMTLEEYANEQLRIRLSPQRMTFTPRHNLQNQFLRRVLMVKNFPSSIEGRCMLADISKIKNTTFSMRLQPMTEGNASALINNQINQRKARLNTSRKATEQIDAATEEDTIVEFYRQMQAGKNMIFLVNVFLEFYADTEKELDIKQLEITNILAGQKITADVLRFSQLEGYLGVQPLGSDPFLKTANNIPSNTLARLYPFSFSTRNDENGLFLGETVDGGYVFLDLDKRSADIPTGNYAVLGQSGQGKTWLQKKIISQEIFKGSSVMILDPDRDYIEMVRTLGGTVLNAASGAVKINPFEVRRLMADQTVERQVAAEDPDAYAQRAHAFRQEGYFFQHLSWLREFFSVLYPQVSQRELNALMLLVQEMYAGHGISEQSDFDMLQPTDYPIFSDLYRFVDRLNDEFDTAAPEYKQLNKELLQDLLLLLQESHTGALGYLFNGYTNIQNDKIICFDLNDLLTGSSSRLQAAIFNIMTYIWNRIALREESILFCVDELSLLLDNKNPVIAQYLSDFAKRIRKYGSKLGTAMQQIETLNDPDIRYIAKPIFANTNFKFLFFPDNSGLDILQDMLKLTDGEIACISKPKQGHCLLKAGDDKYYIKVGELPYERELFGKLSG